LSVGPLGGEFFRAAASATPKLRLAALAKLTAQPYNVVMLECPQLADNFACLDPRPALSDAQGKGASDEAPGASPKPEWYDAVSVVHALA